MRASGDNWIGPLVFGVVMTLASLVPLFDIGGFARHMARQVVDSSSLHRRLGDDFGYWTIRASGLAGLAVAIYIFIFVV